MDNTERLAFRPNEAARVTGLGRDMIFRAIRDGKLRSLKVGKARLITMDALKDFLELCQREAE